MANITVAVIDRRLEKYSFVDFAMKRRRTKKFVVDQNYKITTLMQNIKKACGSNKIAQLTFVGHGLVGPDANSGNKVYVLQICKEYIHEYVASAFGQLKGMFVSRTVPGIEFVSCGPRGSGGSKQSDRALISQGIRMCQAVANAAGTPVRASPDTQDYGLAMVNAGTANPLDREAIVNPGQWEGRVWTFLPGKRGPRTAKGVRNKGW